jgi:hormone-sensitive lipase
LQAKYPESTEADTEESITLKFQEYNAEKFKERNREYFEGVRTINAAATTTVLKLI